MCRGGDGGARHGEGSSFDDGIMGCGMNGL